MHYPCLQCVLVPRLVSLGNWMLMPYRRVRFSYLSVAEEQKALEEQRTASQSSGSVRRLILQRPLRRRDTTAQRKPSAQAYCRGAEEVDLRRTQRPPSGRVQPWGDADNFDDFWSTT